MPPRKSREKDDTSGDASITARPSHRANTLQTETSTKTGDIDNASNIASLENTSASLAEMQTLPGDLCRLAALPEELFDEVLSHLATLPPQFYYDTSRGQGFPPREWNEQSESLRALSQTCRTLRHKSLPRLWARLETCWVPKYAEGTWYKYIMGSLQRKATGMMKSELRHHVRTFTLMLSKNAMAATLASLNPLLPLLPNLHKIHVINCKIPGDFTRAVSNLILPSVTTLFIPNHANALIRVCPNVTHVRCVGGSGSSIIGAFKIGDVGVHVEVFEGMVDWTATKQMDRLVKNAPQLREIEIRRPVSAGLGILSQNSAPPEWVQIIPKLASLRALVTIKLTFPGVEEHASDLASIAAARQVLRKSQVKGEKSLLVRRVIAPHYTNEHAVDFVHSSSTEIFD